MRRRALTVAILAGCGGARPAAPAETPAVTELDVSLTAWADRACACADAACAESLDKEIGRALGRSEVTLGFGDAMDATPFDHRYLEIHRAIQCLWRHERVAFGFEPLVLRATKEYRDLICACPDAACLDAVDDGGYREDRRIRTIPRTDPAEAAIVQLRHEAEACGVALVDRESEVAELLALRDRACACGLWNRACGQEVANDLLALAEVAATPTPHELARLDVIGEELRVCLVLSGWRPAR